jgi:hypothetical protein
MAHDQTQARPGKWTAPQLAVAVAHELRALRRQAAGSAAVGIAARLGGFPAAAAMIAAASAGGWPTVSLALWVAAGAGLAGLLVFGLRAAVRASRRVSGREAARRVDGRTGNGDFALATAWEHCASRFAGPICAAVGLPDGGPVRLPVERRRVVASVVASAWGFVIAIAVVAHLTLPAAGPTDPAQAGAGEVIETLAATARQAGDNALASALRDLSDGLDGALNEVENRLAERLAGRDPQRQELAALESVRRDIAAGAAPKPADLQAAAAAAEAAGDADLAGRLHELAGRPDSAAAEPLPDAAALVADLREAADRRRDAMRNAEQLDRDAAGLIESVGNRMAATAGGGRGPAARQPRDDAAATPAGEVRIVADRAATPPIVPPLFRPARLRPVLDRLADKRPD